MYYYQIIETEYTEEAIDDGLISNFTTIMHEEKFSDKEFSKICNDSITNLREKNQTVEDMKLIDQLVKKYGFKRIQREATFEFESELK